MITVPKRIPYIQGPITSKTIPYPAGTYLCGSHTAVHTYMGVPPPLPSPGQDHNLIRVIWSFDEILEFAIQWKAIQLLSLVVLERSSAS